MKKINGEEIRIKSFRSISYAKDRKGRVLTVPSRYACCFIITLKGRIRFTFDREIIETDANRAIFIPQGTSYTNECLESAESISVNFHLFAPVSSPRALNSIDEKPAMNFYREISQMAYENTESARYYLLSKLYQLAYLLFRSDSAESGGGALAEKALSYLQSEFSRPDLTVDELAAFCQTSAVYLRKILKEAYRKTPFHLLTELRMKKACEMLLEKRPVKEIALSVGYSDVYQFSRSFKRFFGYPPTRFAGKEKTEP